MFSRRTRDRDRGQAQDRGWDRDLVARDDAPLGLIGSGLYEAAVCLAFQTGLYCYLDSSHFPPPAPVPIPRQRGSSD